MARQASESGVCSAAGLERERRSDVHDAVALPRHLLVFGGACTEVLAACVEIAKELLHSPGRRECDHQSTGGVADEREGMRDASRSQHGVAAFSSYR